ncbi:FAD-dependent oxidoreductase [Colwellia echini]|uniref:FAD-dependent oxidoreductase n=1 Tax=Colwellia echini TaxID=1982103 RepID=A0ABY3MVJ6_9GAMM|nr:FAD-dependent oxidoreductase [Colwellia echini]TYK65112.1 FAD-dependent oxidoreductase [Colwellia echini]
MKPDLDLHRDDHCDVIIIGAGVQGSGIAQAAALNGLSTRVFECNADVGLETSSKSSKLIHGGLRYLETFSFSLVRECLKERRLLLKNAPSLVKVNRFYIPIYKTSKRSRIMVYLGLRLYVLLDGDWLGRSIGSINKENWQTLDGLNTDHLKAVFYYQDSQTHDQQLTKAIAKSAQQLGAKFNFNAQVRSIDFLNGEYKVTVAKKNVSKSDFADVDNSDDENTNTQTSTQTNRPETIQTFYAKTLVNASGPWVNQLSALLITDITSEQAPSSVPKPRPTAEMLAIDLVQGVHIVLDCRISDACYYGESPDDGRAVFILPWQGKSLIGTTERVLTDGASSCCASEDEINYLLRFVQFYFPDKNITRNSIVDIFAGVRTLLHSDTNTNSLSRETKILQPSDYPGYFVLYGGKLTVYRATAERLTQQVFQYLGKGGITYKSTENLSLEPFIEISLDEIDA